MKKEQSYIINTNKGYVNTESGSIEFVEKKNARKFTEMEMLAYKNSIVADLVEFHGVSKIISEYA